MGMAQMATEYHTVPDAETKTEVAASTAQPAQTGAVSFRSARADNMRKRIAAIAQERESWESTAYARSNEQLYSLIAQCYQIYKELTDTKSDVAPLRMGLNDYISNKGYNFKTGTPLTAKVVRCVFGTTDRRRVSTYHTVLRVAIDQNWAVADVAKNIAALGGVQEISLGKATGAMTLKEKAAVAAASINGEVLGSFSSDALNKLFNSDETGEKAVAVVVRQADGSFVINAVVHSSAAVNAALSAYYSLHKEKIQKQEAAAQALDARTQRETLIAEAAKQTEVA